MNPNDFRRIDLVCETDGSHPALGTVYLHEGYLYAADGYIAAILPASPEEGDLDGLLPRRAVRMARKAGRHLETIDTELVTVHLKSHDAVFLRPAVEGIHGKLLEMYNTKILKRPGAHPDTHNPHFVIDARLLWRLAKAICRRDSAEGYGLKVFLGDNPDSPILVQPANSGENDVLGAIMPMARVRAGDMAEDKLDLWRTLSKLKETICGGAETVELSGELLEELRKLLCGSYESQE